jgi:hypothetical protein
MNIFILGLTAIDSQQIFFYIGLLYNNITTAFGWVDGTSFDYQNIPGYKPGYIPPFDGRIAGRICSSFFCDSGMYTPVNSTYGLWDLEQLNVYELWNIGPICKKSAYI